MKIKKAILTGGGRATRLHPITTTINKHLLPLANKPMLFHAIDKVVEAGVTDIFININPGETELQRAIGDGGHWGVRITFFEQTGGPQGVAHVVNEAEQFIGDDPFLFYLSDNILLGQVTELVSEFNSGSYDCMLALSTVPDPQRFGVPVFADDGSTLVDVLEKPNDPPNNFAVTGLYVYGPKVFFDAFKRIEKSPRGEYEISSIHSLFLKEGKRVGYKEITGWWKDTGKPDDLLIASQLLMDGMSDESFVCRATLQDDTVVEGNVQVGSGTMIGSNVVLRGPVMIGENCILENCNIGPHVSIAHGCSVKGATIQNSIVLDNTSIDLRRSISDSIIGKQVRLHEDEAPIKKMIIGDKTDIVV